jgi:hypothetical protein
MAVLIKDVLDLVFSPQWGIIRLPDGRGVFYPWGITRLAYVVVSDELYSRIRRTLIIWSVCSLFSSFLLGPLVILFAMLQFMPGTEFPWYLYATGMAAGLAPLIIGYTRWARGVTRNLPLFDVTALDPATAPNFQEGVQRNILFMSTFSLYAVCAITVFGAALGGWIWVTYPDDWKIALPLIGICLLGTALVLNAIRLKRRIPKQDFF